MLSDKLCEQLPFISAISGGCCVLNATNPYECILGFLNWSQAAHEAEWTPFQTYSLENLVALRIEPRPLDV
jgi:hypothetical protein